MPFKYTLQALHTRFILYSYIDRIVYFGGIYNYYIVNIEAIYH